MFMLYHVLNFRASILGRAVYIIDRRMKVGFNTNIPYMGKTYHVQTEDGGIKNPVVVTLLYHQGTILASRKTSYEPFIGRPDANDKIRDLMKLQHALMIKDLVAGKYGAAGGEARPGAAEPEAPGKAATEGAGQISRSLDDVLLDFIIRKHKNNNDQV